MKGEAETETIKLADFKIPLSAMKRIYLTSM
jgi:hypothetical protein